MLLISGVLNALNSKIGVSTSSASTVAKLSGLLLIMGLGIWWMAEGNESQYKDRDLLDVSERETN